MPEPWARSCALVIAWAFFGPIVAGTSDLVTSALADAGGDFRVAVLEHDAEPAATAELTLRRNLDIYDEEARRAAAQGARLLLTPESGLIGMQSSRGAYLGLAVDMPPAPALAVAGRDVFCGAEGKHWMLQRLSCIARSRRLVLVVNFIDVKNCKREPDYPGCGTSRDGWLLFNTDLVFDADGSYLAKYHKANLWGEEYLDAGVSCQASVFTPHILNVTFGVFTCADLVHSWPALHLVSKGVRHFVMPLAWSNEMMQMEPLGWIQAWTSLTNSTVLAANGRQKGKMSGSGIFSRGIALQHVYDVFEQSPRQLLVGALPILPAAAPPPNICKHSRPRFARDARTLHDDRDDEEFEWSFVRLDMSPGEQRNSRVCSQISPRFAPICCELTYEPASDGNGFVLASFSGYDGEEDVDPVAAQACAVLPCSKTDESCLDARNVTLMDPGLFGAFTSLDLHGNFSEAATIFPVVLTWPHRLHATPPNYSDSLRRLRFVPGEAEKLELLEVYGRLFEDDERPYACKCGHEDSTLAEQSLASEMVVYA
eukprot:TRINITY_DN25389_c0_g4_i1.p1 TRINITY_DN25389_c0_g4~~TRINITY_DN25389_c0_g4_i1.p1  ORF type:complete len:540 (-),score=87.14 TRINITY_DN25389_c0_g4_i1:153-1772(-)